MQHGSLTDRKTIAASDSLFQSFELPPFLFEQVPHVPLAYEDDENEETC